MIENEAQFSLICLFSIADRRENNGYIGVIDVLFNKYEFEGHVTSLTIDPQNNVCVSDLIAQLQTAGEGHSTGLLTRIAIQAFKVYVV